MRALLVIVGIAAASACAARDSTGDHACATRASDLAIWGEAVVGQFPDIRLPEDVTLVTTAGAGGWPNGQVMTISILPSGVSVDAARPSAVDAFDPVRPIPSEVALAIDARTPWRDVATVTATLHRMGTTRVILVFATPDPIAKPSSSMDAELDRRTNDLALDMLAAKSVYARCPAAAEPARNDAWKDVATALVACGCKVDIDAARAVAYARRSRSGLARGVEAIVLNVGSEVDEVIGYRGEATWAEVAQSVATAARSGKALTFGVARQ